VKDLFERFDKLFESRIRLAVMSLLVLNDELDFASLKEQLHLSDGNLASHVATLERSGYVRVRKEFVKRTPRTTYSATRTGRKAFADHLDLLERFVKQNA